MLETKTELSAGLKTKAYFDRSADQYSERSTSRLWRWQRARELSAVQTLLGPLDGLDILDIGCGAGFYTRFCLAQGSNEITAIDFSPRMIEQLPDHGVRGIVSNAADFKLEKKFQKIICAGLLEFADKPQDILENARQHVSADGILICLVPPENLAGHLYRKFHQRHNINISLFSNSAFGEIAHQAGWRIDSKLTVFPYTNVYRLKA